MLDQKKPFLYTFEWCGDRNQDMLFRRIWGSPEDYPPNTVWGMHIDINDPKQESVIILVNKTTDRNEIMDKINKAQTYFRKQID